MIDGKHGLAVGAWSLSEKGIHGLAESGIVENLESSFFGLAEVVREDSDLYGASLSGWHLKHWNCLEGWREKQKRDIIRNKTRSYTEILTVNKSVNTTRN